MVFVVLALLGALVATLAWFSMRHGQSVQGCCAPADPSDDLRMRIALKDPDRPG